jgi:polysaccharide deacetylase 2 family uncharacterized protein YibQ
MTWGAIVGALTIALASQLTERRELVPVRPQTAEVEVPGGSEFDRAPPEADPILPVPDAAPSAREPVAVAVPETPPEVPAATATGPAPEPEAPASAPEPAPVAETPAEIDVASPATDAAPASEPGPSAAGAPSAEPAPVAVPQPSPVAEPAEVVQPVAPAAVRDAPAAPPVAADRARAASSAPVPPPGAPAAPPPAMAGAVSAPVAPDVSGNGVTLLRPGEERPEQAPGGAAPSAPATDLPPSAASVPAPPPATPEPAEAPAVPAAPAVAAAPGDTGLPAPGFAGAEGVRVNRLPTIGGASGEETAVPEVDAAATEPEEVAPDAETPAILRHAVAFENPDLRPVMAIVLFHDRPVLPGAETGSDLPVPVSFAVDAGLVEAGAVADAYRAAGREILIVPTLPPGAAATDVEVALQVNMDVMPEAVALMDLPEGGFQSEREAVAQVVAAAARTGHGLVTFPRGLNMAQQMADRAGVPARPVFRMIEAGSPEAALRTLEQAAFRARQEGTVILVGEAEPATVEAIRRWTEANPGSDVLFAPISAALAAGE